MGRKKQRRRSADPGSPWYTVSDVARLLDVTERTVWAWSASGRLPRPVRIGASWTRWAKGSIDSFLMLVAGGCV